MAAPGDSAACIGAGSGTAAAGLSPRRLDRMPPVLCLFGRINADCIISVMSFLGPSDISRCCCVCKQLQALGLLDAVWRPITERLCAGKLHLLPVASDARWRDVYAASCAEASRTEITERDLTQLTWLFRFKRAAGWGSVEPCQAVFTPDGQLLRFNLDGGEPVDPGFAVSWRITKSRGALRGTFVKCNHYPSTIPARTDRWGWRLESEWVMYTTDECDSRFACSGLDSDEEQDSDDE